MRLTDFILMTKNVNSDYQFFVKQASELVPLSKLTLTSSACYFLTGQKPLTKSKIMTLLAKTQNFTGQILINDTNQTIYGIQIKRETGQVICM